MTVTLRSKAKRLCAGAAVISLTIGLGVLSSPAWAASLDEALARTYLDNPTLRATRAELRGVDEGVAQARSGWRPNVEVNGGAGLSYRDSDTGATSTSDGTVPLSGSLDVVQPLYTGGRTDAQVNAAEKDVEAQRALLAAVEQSVLRDAVTAYMNVWSAEAVLSLNQNNERVLRRQLQATRDRFEVGETTRTDVSQAEARLSRAVSSRIQAEGELASAIATYEQVIGEKPSGVEQAPIPGGLPASREETVSAALNDNPNVIAAIFVQQAAEARVDASEAELNPEVNLVGTLAHGRNQTRSNTDSSEASIIAQLVIPIYQQGFVSSQVRESKQISNQRAIEIEEARRLAKQQAIASWEALLTRRSQVESLLSEVRASQIALDGVRQENLVGARTVLDVLDAEQELLNAQVDLVTAQRDVVIASYGALSAVGRLTAGQIGLPVEIYDPIKNYDAVAGKWYGTDIPSE
ncbi:MAG: TolC family outer membrane protein [Limibacillus sp.]